MNCWIGVAAEAHVKTGVAGGFAQLGHGKRAAVAKLSKGDWIAYYAPRATMDGAADAVRAFVAIGEVISDEPYQVDLGQDFAPFRVDVAYRDARPAAVRPLLERLDLTRDRGKAWGVAFRTSLIAATPHDFALIAAAMGVDAPV